MATLKISKCRCDDIIIMEECGQTTMQACIAHYANILMLNSSQRICPPPHPVLFRVRVCMFPPFEKTPLSPVCQYVPIAVCVSSRTLLREKYPFTGHFGNMNA